MRDLSVIDLDGKAMENFLSSMTKTNVGVLSHEESDGIFLCSFLEKYAASVGLFDSVIVEGIERDAQLENDKYAVFSWKFFVDGKETYFNLFAKKDRKAAYEKIGDDDIDRLVRMWCAPSSVCLYDRSRVLGLLDKLAKETNGKILDAAGNEYGTAAAFWETINPF